MVDVINMGHRSDVHDIGPADQSVTDSRRSRDKET